MKKWMSKKEKMGLSIPINTAAHQDVTFPGYKVSFNTINTTNNHTPIHYYLNKIVICANTTSSTHTKTLQYKQGIHSRSLLTC